MNICLLTPRFPFPQNGGDVLRINEIARYLKSKGHILTLVSFSDTAKPDLEAAHQLYDNIYWIRRKRRWSYFNSLIYFLMQKPMQCGYYASKAYERLLRRAIAEQHPDLFVSHLVRLAPYLEKLHMQDRSIIEMTDALSRTYSMSLNAKKGGPLKYVYHFEKRLIERYEQHVIYTFPKTILVSKTDENYLRERCTLADPPLFTFTNGVHCLPHVSHEYDPNRISFIGNMRTLPNQDAVLYFISMIFPRIKKKIPSAKFYIVGDQPPKKIQALASDDVIVKGFVEDIDAEVQRSAIVVAPVRVAAGIQNKVLQAIPVVLSALLAPAIPQLQDGTNCVIAYNDARFAKACVQLMLNADRRNAMANHGYRMVHRHYAWADKLEGYEIMPVAENSELEE